MADSQLREHVKSPALGVSKEDETTSTATTASTTPEKDQSGSRPSLVNDARNKLAYLLAPSCPSVVSSSSPKPEVVGTGIQQESRDTTDTTDDASIFFAADCDDVSDATDEISALRAENARLRAELRQKSTVPAVLGIRGHNCAGCRSPKSVYSRAYVENRHLYCEECWGRWERCGWWWPTMRVSTVPPAVGASGLPEFSGEDAFFLPSFMCPRQDFSLLEELRRELPAGKDFSDWHGARHLGMHFAATDTSGLRTASAPRALRETIEKLETAFAIKASAARLNLYRSSADYKPFHADRGRDEEGVPQVTVGLSLGATRELSFAHYQTSLVTSFPQHNGDVFAFTPELNKVFLHGVPRVRGERALDIDESPRMSLILWGSRVVVQRAADAAKRALDITRDDVHNPMP